VPLSSLTNCRAKNSSVSFFLSTAVIARGSSTIVLERLYINPTFLGENDTESSANAIGRICGRAVGSGRGVTDVDGDEGDFMNENIDFFVFGSFCLPAPSCNCCTDPVGDDGEMGEPGKFCKLTRDEFLLPVPLPAPMT